MPLLYKNVTLLSVSQILVSPKKLIYLSWKRLSYKQIKQEGTLAFPRSLVVIAPKVRLLISEKIKYPLSTNIISWANNSKGDKASLSAIEVT